MEPEVVHELFEKRCNEGDLEGLVALYEPEAAMVQPDGTIVSGIGAIREGLVELLSTKPKMKVRHLRTIRAGDIAVLISDWEVTGIGPDGSETSDGGRTYDVIRRQADGTWKAVVDNPYGFVPE